MSGTITMESSKTAWIGSLEWSYSGGSVTVTMYTGKTDGYPSSAPSGANFNATITVDGTSRKFSYQQQDLDMYVGSVTAPVSGSTVTISGRVDAPYGVSMYGYPLTGSQTVTLKTEPTVSASEITLGASTVQMGDKLLISIDRDDPGCKHDLVCWIADNNEFLFAEDVDSSYAWTVPDLTDQCPNGLTLPCVVVCITKYKGSYIGYNIAEVTLTVPDATVPALSGGELTLGTESTVLCKRNSAHFDVDLELEFKDTTVSIASGKLDSQSWTPGYDLARQIPNLTYGTGTLKCTTRNGTAVVGTETVTVRITVPENDITRPRFQEDGFILSPVAEGLDPVFASVYIRGKTGLSAAFSAVSDYSTIRDYELTVGNQTVSGNPAVVPVLVSDGTVKVTGRVTDARGFSATVSTTVQVIPYRNPKIVPASGYDTVICERAKENGELSSDGTWLGIRAGISCSSIILDGQERNLRALWARMRSSGADWGGAFPLIAPDEAQTEVSLLIPNAVDNLQTSYEVQLIAMDFLGGEHILTFQIMTEAVSFVLYDGPDGAGFGKYPEAPHVVDIASHMTLLVRGKLVVAGSDWTDLGVADGVTESGYEHIGRAGPGCFYRVSNGNHVYVAFNCAFSYNGSRVVINETPIPAGYRSDRNVFGYCFVSDGVGDRYLAMVGTDASGSVYVEWVQRLTESSATGPIDMVLVDGYLDYWI